MILVENEVNLTSAKRKNYFHFSVPQNVMNSFLMKLLGNLNDSIFLWIQEFFFKGSFTIIAKSCMEVV